ncbi:MAG TPA: zinc ribbon domain-containing protein [Pyrinomonadaceae bacterium]|nr:zinc ribbon domain-containing protein [Pyrinomonadaceae bacterium]
MFCPQCGQQSSDEIRFCPRCGLSLVPHAALLAGGGSAADGAVVTQAPVRTRRRVQMRRAAKLMFFSVVLLPVFIGLGIAADGAEPMLLPFFAFMAGLAWLVYAWLFIDDYPHAAQEQSRKDLKAGAESPALGAAQFAPAPLFGRQSAHTAEIAPPPSVTENTTKLLDPDS